MPEGLGREFDEPLDKGEFAERLKDLTPEQRKGFWRVYMTGQNRIARAEAANRRLLAQEFRRATEDILGRVRQTFDIVQEDGTWTLTTARRMQRDQDLFRQIRERIGALGLELNAQTERQLVAAFKRSWIENAYRTDTLTPPSAAIRFNLLPDEGILGLLRQPVRGANFSERLGVITDEMADNIKRELLRSMIAGETWNTAARRIRGEMGTRGRKAMWRAEMIARTELTRATELGAYEFHSDNEDIIDEVVWMAHPGACPECRALNGRRLRDPEDYPPNLSHPNCTCDAVAIPKPWDDLMQGSDPKTASAPPNIAAWADQRRMPREMVEA